MSGRTLFTNDDIEQILRVVDRLSDVEVWLELGDIKLHVRKSAGAKSTDGRDESPVESPTPTEAKRSEWHEATRQSPESSTRRKTELPPGTAAIRAPMLGKFYRSSSPTELPFVEIGQKVRAADPVCLIEVMKLFNTVNAGIEGTIISIAVENEAMVESDDILFVVKVD